MKFPLTILITLLFAIFSGSIAAQTTRQLFSKPGLSIGAYHLNIYDGTWSTSYRYAGDTIACNDTLLLFEALENTNNKVALKIQNGSVWLQSWQNLCATGQLFYNFDLNTGQSFTLPGGPVVSVQTKSTKVLLNGETRRYLKLTDPGNSFVVVEWIDGIGDVTNGLLPAFYDFEGYDRFICARDNAGALWESATERDKCDSLLCARPLSDFKAITNDKTTTFENKSQNATHWVWEFGDGESSTEENPVHTYSSPGCYEVCLTSYTDCRKKGERLCLPSPVCVDPSWATIPSTPWTQSIVDIDFINPNTGWVITRNTIWKTDDAGAHWQQQFLPAADPGVSPGLFDIDMLNEQKGIIGFGNFGGNGSEKAILITNDGGLTWEKRAPDSYFITDVMLTPDGKAFASGQFKELLYSPDGGNTWETRDIPGGSDVLWMQYLGNDTLYAFSYQGLPPQHTPMFLKSYNSGLSWKKILMPQYPSQTDASFLNTLRGWAVGDTGFMLQTTDGGDTWHPYPFGESVKVNSIEFVDEFKGWAVGQKGLVLHTTHGGLGWKRENCSYLGNMSALSVPAPLVAYAGGAGAEMRTYHPNPFPDCGLSSPTDSPEMSENTLRIKPNPASGWISIETGTQPGKLCIYNAIGQLCLSRKCETEMTFLDVTTFPSGRYTAVFLSDQGDSKISNFVR